MLELLNLPKPAAMSGHSLLARAAHSGAERSRS
jgi:hypothetical protein